MSESEIYIGEQPIKRIRHIVNESSTNADKMIVVRERLKQGLRSFGFSEIDHVYVYTTFDPSETVRELHDTTRRYDLNCVWGGESTDNIAARAATTGPLRGLQIPHLIFPGGDKSDLSHTLNQDNITENPMEALFSSVLETIHPIEFHAQSRSQDQIIDEVAVSYGGIGTIAKSGQLISTRRKGPIIEKVREHRHTRFISNALLALEGIARARKFKAVNHKQNNEIVELSELAYINGDRMAGSLIITPIEIYDDQAVRIEAATKSDLIAQLVNLAIGNSPRNIVNKIDDDFTLLSDALLHIDGEHRSLSWGTSVQITRSEAPFYVLSSRKPS